MEFDEIVVKESPGLCRCCLSEGCYKDLGSEYTWMNDTEVYADMLLECFDISITQHNDGPNGPNRLICEVCITRLRDACNFKKQVLDSEKKFIDMMGRGEFRPKVLIYQAQMKCEEPPGEAPTEETEVEYLDDDIDFVDDTEDVIKDETEPSVSDITVSSLPIKGKRGRPRKNLVKTEKKAKVAKLDDKPKSSKTVAKDAMAGYNFISKDRNIGSKADSAKFKSYLITMLQKSTAMPFRRHESHYKCFYCERTFLLTSDLREHNAQQHKYMDFDESLRIWTEFNLASHFMVDIQGLSCRVCNTKLSDMNDLKIHFSERHDELLPKEVLNNVMCFKLSDDAIKCFLCTEEFELFGNLMHHMESNSHLSCQICNEKFSTNKDFVEHEKTYCKPCSLCDMRFQSKKHRDAHLRLVHCKGFQCDFCSQQFTLKVTLARHIRNIHYKEKNGTCDVCGKTFFDTHYLNLHKVSHTKIKPYECDVCKKKFTRNEAMKLHKRIHNNDRRYVCKVCGKSFIQWVSLNMHKVVHSEERNFKCAVCDRAFKDKKALGKHCKNVHQKEDIKTL